MVARSEQVIERRPAPRAQSGVLLTDEVAIRLAHCGQEPGRRRLVPKGNRGVMDRRNLGLYGGLRSISPRNLRVAVRCRSAAVRSKVSDYRHF
jgi:hypothetical protein